eukprot:CAMPEP_0171325132 /NCGR_PEP_ID=MMETSP0816-20121228/116612_1 /TAXON_ID=420281 /ORGANISM="Proboscia inermis, Strain CCAP1064/1" /LENGTH=50 /DNA_ID=CAMNT_0011824231 /DNA_START=874 /DNA_END=1026 /DNA_ORIENTATION=+
MEHNKYGCLALNSEKKKNHCLALNLEKMMVVKTEHYLALNMALNLVVNLI